MQKKLLAAAVGSALGAFAAPAAMAQNATVNVYGNLYGEYSGIKNGSKSAAEPYQKVDMLQNPDSYIGFRGEEKLGGGMSAWFQCEITMDWRGTGNAALSNAQGTGTLCSRTSALGLKSQYMNTFFGNWATPFNRAAGSGLYVGANSTGVFGISHLMFGGASTYGISSASAFTNTVTPGAWARRQNNLMTIESANIAGFQVMAATTAGNSNTGATLGQLRTRLYSAGVRYENYGLGIGLGYEKHKNFYAATLPGCPVGSACVGSDERALAFQAQYTFAPARLKVGGGVTQQRADNTTNANGARSEAKVTAWNVGMDWMFYGPHGVRVNYARAGDLKGTPNNIAGVATGAIGGASQRPSYAAAATALLVPGGFASTGAGTSANMWQVRYVYQFSKRTEGTLGYSATRNSSLATYETGGTTTGAQFPGQKSNAFAMALRHAF